MRLPDWDLINEHAAALFIDAWAFVYTLPRHVCYGLISQESRFNPRARRDEPRLADASYGLTQILWHTAQGLGYRGDPEGLYDSDTNVKLGLLYFRNLLRRFESLSIAISAYNGGYRHHTITNQPYLDAVNGRADYFEQQFAAAVATSSPPAPGGTP